MFVIYLINFLIQYLWKLCKHHLEADSWNSADFQTLSSLSISSHPAMPSLETGSSSLPFTRIFNIWRNLSITSENLLCILWPDHFKAMNSLLFKNSEHSATKNNWTRAEHRVSDNRRTSFRERGDLTVLQSSRVLWKKQLWLCAKQPCPWMLLCGWVLVPK